MTRSRRLPLAIAAAVAVALAGLAPSAVAVERESTSGANAAAPGPSREAVATLRNGVRTIGDLPVGPLGPSGDAVSTLADVRAIWGPERIMREPAACVASWGTGVRLLFTTFGGPAPCAERFLQVATITGPRWVVKIGQQGYRIGLPRRSLPASAKLIRGWQGGGYELATMPFIGGRTTSVMAHVGPRGRVDRFVLFIGAAGD